jgi:ADP-ribosylglycohydrolase
MLGAIIGDIVGSVYEWHNIKTKDFPLFRDNCFFTDDTVMTVATADAIMNGSKADDFINAYKKWGQFTRMPGTVVASAVGYIPMTVSPTTLGAMVQPCVFLPARNMLSKATTPVTA